MTEQEQKKLIIQGCKKGDQQAFSKLIDLYSDRCYGYFCRLTGNRTVSNDLLSELFFKLVQKISTYKDGSFDKWIFTVASNVFRDYLRRKYRQKKLLDHAISEFRENPETKNQSDISDMLTEQIAKLDAETAELITLRYYGQLSFKELAEIRNEPIGTTLSKVHRGIKELKKLMNA